MPKPNYQFEKRKREMMKKKKKQEKLRRKFEKNAAPEADTETNEAGTAQKTP